METSPEAARPDTLLFGETQSTIVVSCAPVKLPLLKQTAGEHGIDHRVLGTVGGNKLIARHPDGRILINLSVEEMESLWRMSIAKLMG